MRDVKMLAPSKSYAVSYPNDVYMPEFGRYGNEHPISEWQKPENKLKENSVDVKTLAEQFESMKNEIEKLNVKIGKLENEKIAENTLIQLWDNEYDDQWNDC